MSGPDPLELAGALEDFSKWILREVAERRDQQGRKPARGRRRSERSDGTLRPIPLQAAHICYTGDADGQRGSDLSLRLALAVEACQRAQRLRGTSTGANWNACVSVADYPHVKKRLGKSNRSKSSSGNGFTAVARVETVRSMANNKKRALGTSLDQIFAGWFGGYRAEFCRSEGWYAEQESNYLMRAQTKDPSATTSLARFYHEQSKNSPARNYYILAKWAWMSSPPTRRGAVAIEWIDAQIENIRSERPPDPSPSHYLPLPGRRTRPSPWSHHYRPDPTSRRAFGRLLEYGAKMRQIAARLPYDEETNGFVIRLFTDRLRIP